MPSKLYAYVNGRFVPEAEATVSIFDRGFLYGEGCFETMRLYRGRIFRIAEHLKRLGVGLNTLEIEMILSAEELQAVCRALIQSNAVTNGVVRIYQTQDSLVVTVRACEYQSWTLSAMVSNRRIDKQLSGIKSANRLSYILAQSEAQRKGVEEAVLLNDRGNVVEFTRSNLFVVQNSELYTPPLSDGPLPGITRHAVLALARETQIPVQEKSFNPDFLDDADEVFATNSLIEIAPVVQWSCCHDMTTRLQAAYRDLVAHELNMPAP